MKPSEAFEAKAVLAHGNVPGPAPARVRAFSRYAKSIRENGADVLISVGQWTTGGDRSFVLDRIQVGQLAGNLAAEVESSWVSEQDELHVSFPAGQRVAILDVRHRISRVDTSAPVVTRSAALTIEQTDDLVFWLERWITEGWS